MEVRRVWLVGIEYDMHMVEDMHLWCGLVAISTTVPPSEVKQLVHVTEEVDQKFERILDPARY